MKTLLVDIAQEGHHENYLRGALEAAGRVGTVVVAIPKAVALGEARVYEVAPPANENLDVLRWLRELSQIVLLENVDQVHFLTGDVLAKMFGIGLSRFKGVRTIATFHHMRHTELRDCSMRHILRHLDTLVVHTDSIVESVRKLGADSISKIDYPFFADSAGVTKAECRAMLGLPPDTYLLLAVGGTRRDKGLNILLDALHDVEEDFHLLVAGKEDYFSREYIEGEVREYADKVTLNLGYLTDLEYATTINAADAVVLPYLREFDGASGPLVDAVFSGKAIIGPDHGSLGRLIRDYHLGYTFEAENSCSLACAIDCSIRGGYQQDEVCKNYIRTLDVARFVDSYSSLYSAIREM